MQTIDQIVVALLAGTAMAIGLLGTVLPVVPGLVLIWGAAWVYGIVAGFGPVGWVVITTQGALLAAGTVLALYLPRRAGAAHGMSATATLLAVVLGIVGFFVIPVVGAPIGAVAGVLLVERVRHRSWRPAWQATKGVLMGIGLAAVVQFGVGVVMIGLWVAWVVANALR